MIGLRLLQAGAFVTLAVLATEAHAYCVQNQLAGKSVRVEQEPHPDKLRAERTFRHMLAPGERRCCHFKNLDCNPLGRRDAIVSISVVIVGEPEHHCGYPEGAEPNVKVTGGGMIRIQDNPRRRSASPYIVRVRTHDKDITGPRGLACPAIPTKGKP
jgi:hypothetical protein